MTKAKASEYLDHQAGERATALQTQAAAPDVNVFVTANAGTGKTQVLTMRVLHLLLSGADPDTILCLTYTKAAAAEMRSRLYQRLSDWAICDETKLSKDIAQITNSRVQQTQIDLARSLFAHILDFEDGPKIETVHSFCQSILRRFPVEAGVAPQFDMISDYQRDVLMQNCFFSMLDETLHHPETPASRALHILSQQTDDSQIFSHLKQFLSHRRHADKMANDPAARISFDKKMVSEIGFFEPEKLPDLMAKLQRDLADYDLPSLVSILNSGGIQQQGRGRKIQSWLDLGPDQKIGSIDRLIFSFLTKEGQKLSRLTDKAIDKAFPDCASKQSEIAAQLQQFIECRASAKSYQLTSALTDAGSMLYRRFQSEKANAGLLDYDDLIFYTEQLLSQDQMMAWVRWKLDNGINHLLIDEAQDTSPEQWALIRHLADPFFDQQEGESSRTIFAVGDFKQSIYSFQGARPQIFSDSQKTFEKRLHQARKPFKNIDFTLSFRSASAVLDFVDQVISQPHIGGLGQTEPKAHQAHRIGMAGLVEVWPVLEGGDKQPAPYLDVPELRLDEADGALLQARRVVGHIKGLLAGAEADHFGCQIRPQDILILLRKRDRFYALLRAELERADIPVAGADRISLNNQIEILDLLALADVCLLPENDLQLACLLKSPLVGLVEDELMALATTRGQKSLFDALMTHDGSDNVFGQAAAKITQWRFLSMQRSVFEFFSIVLSSGGRSAFHRRLGHAVDESLNAFLLRARDHGELCEPGLLHFVTAFRQGDSTIKRDLDNASNGEIRVMSIHGAKGLEAPIVYLPDMLKAQMPSQTIISSDAGVFWPAGTPMPAFMQSIKDAEKEMRDEEADRLLYVALTRARQALFISGWQRKRTRTQEDSWYDLLLNSVQNCKGAYETADGIWRLCSGRPDPNQEQKQEKVHVSADGEQPPSLPKWFTDKPEDEPVPARPLTPSHLGEKDYPVSFGVRDRKKALMRGSYVHKLLEILPGMKTDQHWPAALRLAEQAGLMKRLAGQAPYFNETELRELCDQVLAVMQKPELEMLFGQHVLIEAAISGLVGEIVVQGQIDRLVILDDEVIIADFKTGMPPAQPQDIPASYISQMSLYSALIKQIYPDRIVRPLLIWTQDLSAYFIDEKQQQKALDHIMAIQKDRDLSI